VRLPRQHAGQQQQRKPQSPWQLKLQKICDDTCNPAGGVEVHDN
jgi:hypothetical protein